MNRTAGILTTSSERNSENTLCRLCMKNNDYFYNIFTSNVACRMTVKDAIKGLLGLEVAVGDGLPTTMCPLCLRKLTELSVFKMTSLESDAKLRKFSGFNCFRSIQGDEAADDELGSSADTKDFVQNEIEGTSHLTHSVQRTEIYIPVPDSHQFKDNMLETVKEENEDPLSEGIHPLVYTPDPAKTSSNALDPLAINDLSDIGTCGSSSVKADQFSDDGGGYAHNNSTNGATNDLVSQASDQPTVTENGELIQNYSMAMESMAEDVESPAPERASALFAVLEPKISASHSRKRKDVMDKDINECDNLLADQITLCLNPNDGRLHSKSRYAYEIGGDRATTTIAEKRGGCDNADTIQLFKSTENGKNGPEVIIREIKVKSTCTIKNPGNCASSTKKSYHCFICRDVFNAKYDLINHLKIHFGSGKLDIDSNLSVEKDLSHKTVVSSRENSGFCLPFSSKSLNQLMCKSQEVGQKRNRLLKEKFGGTRENKNVREVRKSFHVDGKPCTVIPHTAKKSYFCSECEKSFSRKSTLVSHIRTHAKEKPYSCNECDKSFSVKSNLVSHIRTHTKSKPYSCSECKKSFHKKGDLVRHMRTHTKEKPHSCCECEKSFFEKSHLVTNYFRVKLKLPGGNPVLNLAQVYRDAVHIRDLVEGRSTRRSIQCGGRMFIRVDRS
ncbi:zinc finger protein 558-like [Ischnura elegans]|uniref:zinc finger protein 558-like n=1 Tax=Ischnura elegans TaxID=197161 RepID=UPI001ED8A811|nr:zinc finger protein 558-like [Ischnura elegans]